MAEAEIENRPKMAAPRKRRSWRRNTFYMPPLPALVTLALMLCALFGTVLGDIWLWRLLYG